MIDVTLPLAMSQTRAEAVAAHLLAQGAQSGTADVAAGLSLAGLEIGDLVQTGEDAVWRIETITDEGAARQLGLAEAVAPPARRCFRRLTW